MTTPQQGDVWYYDYLWHWEHESGYEHGRKPRPTAIVAAIKGKDGRTNLFILPITTKAPPGDREAIAIPQIERRRASLSDDLELWIMLDEYNHEFLETTFNVDPNGRVGALSPLFASKVLTAFRKVAKQAKVKQVPRGE